MSLLKKNEQVILIEKNDCLGGTSTAGGVNTWEPGVAGNGVHYHLAANLIMNKQAGIGKTVKTVSADTPYAYSGIVTDSCYEDTLRRSGKEQDEFRRFHFEPEAMASLMYSFLKSHKNLIIMFLTEVTEVMTSRDRVTGVIVRHHPDQQEYEIEADYFADCTGDIILARKAGCQYSQGEDSFKMYHEKSAPLEPSLLVNGVTKMFRCTKTDTKRNYKMPMEYINENTRNWMKNIYAKKIVSVINEYPNGDLNINLLPTMDGYDYFDLPDSDREYFLLSRTYAYFEFLSSMKAFEPYRISKIFQETGIRESYRLVGRYVLKEQDIISSRFKEHVLCYADHALDTHGKTNIKGHRAVELSEPYGIPEDCIRTNEYDNLVVASRGASFSHIAASSCRLSRTMIALGEGGAKVLYSMAENRV